MGPRELQVDDEVSFIDKYNEIMKLGEDSLMNHLINPPEGPIHMINIYKIPFTNYQTLFTTVNITLPQGTEQNKK